MIARKQFENAKKQTMEYLEKAGIAITGEEKAKIEVVDFCLGDLKHMGVEILTYVNTAKVCAKELVLFPCQTCAEHIHPTINDVPGKEETFRCRWGKVYLYVDGSATANVKAKMHKNLKGHVTVFHEIKLNPGDQHTLYPDTLHWFQAGPEGAVISEFSTTSTDELDRFTDPRIGRFTKVNDDEEDMSEKRDL